jgi:hypothetical protein
MSDFKIVSSITDFWHDVRDMCESAPGLNQMLGGITYRLMRDNAAADAFAQQPNAMLVQKLVHNAKQADRSLAPGSLHCLLSIPMFVYLIARPLKPEAPVLLLCESLRTEWKW